MGGESAVVELSVPHGDDERLVRYRQCAGEMHCIGAPQGELSRELTSVMPDGRRQFDRPGRAPELPPVLLGLLKAIPVEVMVPMRGSECGPDLGVGLGRVGVLGCRALGRHRR